MQSASCTGLIFGASAAPSLATSCSAQVWDSKRAANVAFGVRGLNGAAPTNSRMQYQKSNVRTFDASSVDLIVLLSGPSVRSASCTGVIFGDGAAPSLATSCSAQVWDSKRAGGVAFGVRGL